MNTSGPTVGAQHDKFVVSTDEDVGALRRGVAEVAARTLGTRAARAALAATELGTNLLRHGAGGYVLVRPLVAGLELLAVDSGPGMPPGARTLGMVPHASPSRGDPDGGDPDGGDPDGGDPDGGDPGRRPTKGLGVGLSAVRRAATVFDLYSTTRGGSAPAGTVVLARFLEGPPRPGWCRWGAVNVAIEEGGISGDGWAVSALPLLVSVLVVDGLGHGREAGLAAAAAVSAFGADPSANLEELVRRAHEAMRPTRGGVLAVCSVNPELGELRYGAIGNISGMLLNDRTSQRLLGRDGILGTSLVPPSPRVNSYPWSPGAVLVLASDGLRSSWDPLAYPGLLSHDPAVIAAVLQRDYGRPNDDATVLVVCDLRASNHLDVGAGNIPAIQGETGQAAGAGQTEPPLLSGPARTSA